MPAPVFKPAYHVDPKRLAPIAAWLKTQNVNKLECLFNNEKSKLAHVRFDLERDFFKDVTRGEQILDEFWLLYVLEEHHHDRPADIILDALSTVEKFVLVMQALEVSDLVHIYYADKIAYSIAKYHLSKI